MQLACHPGPLIGDGPLGLPLGLPLKFLDPSKPS